MSNQKIIIRDKRVGSWFWIHKSVWSDSNISSSEKIVYATLAYFANESDQTSFPSRETLRTFCGVAIRTLSRSLKALEIKKYITVQREFGQPNIYTLLDIQEGGAKMALVPNGTGVGPNSTTPPATEYQGVGPNSTTNNTYINNNIYIQVFDRWNSHKIVVHRELTSMMKGRINGKLKNYSLDEILMGIENYSRILSDENCYFKHKWSLVNFLDRGFERFLDYNSAHENFRKKGKQEMEQQGSGYMNILDWEKKYGKTEG